MLQPENELSAIKLTNNYFDIYLICLDILY